LSPDIEPERSKMITTSVGRRTLCRDSPAAALMTSSMRATPSLPMSTAVRSSAPVNFTGPVEGAVNVIWCSVGIGACARLTPFTATPAAAVASSSAPAVKSWERFVVMRLSFASLWAM
jgi:hypothetical protein